MLKNGNCIIKKDFTRLSNLKKKLIREILKKIPQSQLNGHPQKSLPNIVNFSFTTQIKALKIKEKYKLQYYDCLIIATALENACTILYSEDMQHGQIIENQIKIINPFQICHENQE